MSELISRQAAIDGVDDSVIRLQQGDCLELMRRLPDKSVDLTVTSPPYDNLRTYNGNISQWSFEKFQQIAKELYRITDDGGAVVWIVADATIKGSETGTSFRQVLWFMDCGFNLHDTMIWEKPNSGSVGSLNRYEQTTEYMFVLSKGKLKTANIICDKLNKRGGEIQHGSIRQADGSTRKTTQYGKKKVNEYGRRHNLWMIAPEMSNTKRCHPAQFPEKLAHDHIISWSRENDTVLDCFMGSGTTGVVCVNLKRKFIGMEIEEEYFKIAKERINNARLNQQTGGD